MKRTKKVALELAKFLFLGMMILGANLFVPKPFTDYTTWLDYTVWAGFLLFTIGLWLFVKVEIFETKTKSGKQCSEVLR